MNIKKDIKNTDIVKYSRIPIIIIALILSACLITGGAFAFFTDYITENKPNPVGELKVILIEDDPFDDLSNISEEGALTDTKTFRAKSIGTINAYTRAKIILSVEYFDEDEQAWVVANIPVSDINVTVTAPDWIYSDGYYYYKYVLYPTDLSSDVVVKIESIDNIPERIKDAKIKATIKIVLESAQVRHDLWKDTFGIEALPAGVETE